MDLGSAGDLLWLSAPKPIVSQGTPFTPDLQTSIRTDGLGALARDWERIGTDVTTVSLTGVVMPEPST